MEEIFIGVISTFIGGLLAIIGCIMGSVITQKKQDNKEVKQFYSWIAFLLNVLFNAKIENDNIDNEKIKRVSEDLTTPEVHYTFNKIWMWIPENNQNLEIRELIYWFLKNGDKVKEIILDEQRYELYKKLYGWLVRKAGKRL